MQKKQQKNQIHEQASLLLGLGTEIIGKTEARQRFLPLVSDLKTHPRTVEITEQDNPVAVLLPYNHYVALISQLSKLSGRVPNLTGSVVIVGDLDAASKSIGDELEDAIKRSAANL